MRDSKYGVGDERGTTGSRTGAGSEPRPADASAGAGIAVAGEDLQTILSAAVRRLGEATGATRVAAWAQRPDGTPFVAAASFEGGAPQLPSADDFQALSRLDGATDLGTPGVPDAARRVGAAHRFTAAAPVGGRLGEPLALLLLGGAEPQGRVRPRTLAALNGAARHLEAPAEGAAALARLFQLDEGVRRLDRLAALGDLVAEIVHEVRNPLVSVKTFLQLLPERVHEPDFRTRFLDVVNGELRRIERLLDVVLEHARPRAPSAPENAAAVGPVLESVARLLAHRALERSVQIEAATTPDLPGVALSEDGLRQVVLNLALNAIDVTRSGGMVRLRAQPLDGGVEIVVEDEGPGIEQELRERVFEPFFSTKQERPGGLGLAICRRIVEEAGGRIVISDRIGGGVAFRFTVPRSG
jgi:signal transduction histidine kinase